ncbi:GreA/GreB family elongation factor, partial [Candidatus Dojkabacteria bacterium]|nr:GreA/GreB family elongation factor [Candidatus Dojkabacteria bacterium]
MDDNSLTFTEEGLKNIEEELEDRKTNVRTKIADDIDKAREQGDLSENAAYKAALEAKEFNENRITELEDMLNRATISEKAEKGLVGIGVKVKLQNLSNNSEYEFDIVGQSEADPVNKKISIESPI